MATLTLFSILIIYIVYKFFMIKDEYKDKDYFELVLLSIFFTFGDIIGLLYNIIGKILSFIKENEEKIKNINKENKYDKYDKYYEKENYKDDNIVNILSQKEGKKYE